MSLASLIHHGRIDAFAVVRDSDAQAVPVLDLRFDGLRFGMLECIAHRLERDAVDFVAQDRVDIPRRSLHPDIECGRTFRGHLVARRAYGPREIVRFDGGRAHVLDRLAAFSGRRENMLEAACIWMSAA